MLLATHMLPITPYHQFIVYLMRFFVLFCFILHFQLFLKSVSNPSPRQISYKRLNVPFKHITTTQREIIPHFRIFFWITFATFAIKIIPKHSYQTKTLVFWVEFMGQQFFSRIKNVSSVPLKVTNKENLLK